MEKYVINEEFLQQLETLETILHNNVSGMFGGNRKSKRFGSSPEFADYRDYIPGDDMTKIDWNAYARFDKLYLKLFLDERQMHTRIYIDASRSMEFGQGEKGEVALKLAAALAYISVCEMDKVSIYALKDKAVYEVAVGMVGKDSFYNNIGKLNGIVFEGDSFISEAIIPSTVGYGDGLSVIISDFLTENDFDSAIDYLTDKRRDILCIQLLTPEELNPQIRGKSHLFDSEDERKFFRKNITRDIIAAYKRATEYVRERIRSLCESHGATYIFSTTDRTVSDILFGSLTDMGVIK